MGWLLRYTGNWLPTKLLRWIRFHLHLLGSWSLFCMSHFDGLHLTICVEGIRLRDNPVLGRSQLHSDLQSHFTNGSGLHVKYHVLHLRPLDRTSRCLQGIICYHVNLIHYISLVTSTVGNCFLITLFSHSTMVQEHLTSIPSQVR